MVDAQVHAVRHAAHLRRDPDRGGLGDPAGAGHEPGFVGGVSAWAEVRSEWRGGRARGCAGVVGSCCVRGFCGRACALRWAVGSSGCVGAVARVRRFRPEKFFSVSYDGADISLLKYSAEYFDNPHVHALKVGKSARRGRALAVYSFQKKFVALQAFAFRSTNRSLAGRLRLCLLPLACAWHASASPLACAACLHAVPLRACTQLIAC